MAVEKAWDCDLSFRTIITSGGLKFGMEVDSNNVLTVSTSRSRSLHNDVSKI